MNETSGTIFLNGRIYTANEEKPYADAIEVKDGKIVWIGEEKEWKGNANKKVDLKGRRILPGIIDAHLHPLQLAKMTRQITCTYPVVKSIEDLKAQVREQLPKINPGEWIEGWGYDESKLSEGRAPNRWDLDQVAPDVPVVLTRSCGHIIAVNSKALETGGINKDTPSPAGGEIDRDEKGEATGILRENAKEILLQHRPVPTLEEEANLLAELSTVFLSYGITGITEMGAVNQPNDYFEIYNAAGKIGLKQRTVLYYHWKDFQQLSDIESKIDEGKAIHIGGIKIFADGSVSGRTALVKEGYSGDESNFGILTTTKENLLGAAAAAERYGVQVAVHAMGDEAIDLIINTYSEQVGWLKDTVSIRLEHAAMPTEAALQSASEHGIAFIPQPIFLFAEIESYLNNLGEEKTKKTYPVQTMLDRGIQVAFSSDAPATAWSDPVNPFIGIGAAVTRKAYNGTDTGQDESVDVETALRLYTKEAAKVANIPDVGQLAPGYAADFIVLDKDILAINGEDITDIVVEETYIGGELVYERDAVKG